ncbi:MAG: transketolase family protein [Treponema sp.]|nr:transketolase family protein [Treponema sp.]
MNTRITEKNGVMGELTMEDLRDVQIKTYIDLVKQGVDIYYLVSDSVSTSKVKPFRELFPKRVINVGIAEQNMMGMAAGMANGGVIPVTGNATPFLISRSNENLKIDISYAHSNVKVNGMHAGFSYGTDGITHHEINDIGFIRGMPGFEIYAPCDPRECRQMTNYGVVERKGPVYTSLNTGKFHNITPDNYVFQPGLPLQLSDGKDITIIALGTAVHDVLEAVKKLNDNQGKSLSCAVFAITSIRPFTPSILIDSINETGMVLTVEQHSTHGGIGSLIAELIADNGLGAKLKRLGVPEGSFSKNWSQVDNKTHFKLDAAGIAETIQEMCSKNNKELIWNTSSQLIREPAVQKH